MRAEVHALFLAEWNQVLHGCAGSTVAIAHARGPRGLLRDLVCAWLRRCLSLLGAMLQSGTMCLKCSTAPRRTVTEKALRG